MSRPIAFAAAGGRELWSLIVDDGFLALAALIAVGVTFVVSREAGFGPTDAVGWILAAMLAAAMAISVRRALPRGR